MFRNLRPRPWLLPVALVLSVCGAGLSSAQAGQAGVADAIAAARAANANTRETLARNREAQLRQMQPAQIVVVNEAPRFSTPIAKVLSVGQFSPDEHLWRLAESLKLPTNIDTRGQTYAMSLLCSYRGTEYRSVRVWQGSRPALPPAGSEPMEGPSGIRRSLTADVAVSRCPPTWGEALSAIWGPDAWAQLQATPEAKESLRFAAQRQDEASRMRQEAWDKLSEWERCYRTLWGKDSLGWDDKQNSLHVALTRQKCG